MGRFKLNKFDVLKIAKRTIYGFVSTAVAFTVINPDKATQLLDSILPISIASAITQAIITIGKNLWDDHSEGKE